MVEINGLPGANQKLHCTLERHINISIYVHAHVQSLFYIFWQMQYENKYFAHSLSLSLSPHSGQDFSFWQIWFERGKLYLESIFFVKAYYTAETFQFLFPRQKGIKLKSLLRVYSYKYSQNKHKNHCYYCLNW